MDDRPDPSLQQPHDQMRVTREKSAVVTLAGGFTCDITVSQKNAWHEYVWSQIAFTDYCLAKDAANWAARNAPDMESVAAARHRELNATHALYELGKKWYAENVAPQWEKIRDGAA